MFINSIPWEIPLWEISPLLCTDRKQGGISLILKKVKKSQILECSEKLKNEVLSNLEGVDFGQFWSRIKEISPLLCTDLQQGGGGISQGTQLMLLG